MKDEWIPDIASIAVDFIKYTTRNIFLTGGAGTGKSTILSSLKGCSNKRMAICAPTAVAAVNVGGVTVHSLFGLPPRPLDEEAIKNIQISNQTRQVLRELEILILDEVSMLRADVLDAMNYLLKEIRQNKAPLGGLQIVLIGDLFQLPPVETNQDRESLRMLYSSLYFTSSKVIKDLNVLMLELTKVHRQSDQEFITLLNAVRTGSILDNQLNELNKFYRPELAESKSIILTTHNQRATEYNTSELCKMEGEAYTINGHLKGDFTEDQLPVELNLTLKYGCPVMMLRNDTSKNPQFYNGKIGTITSISDEMVEVTVEDGTSINVGTEIWNNITYVYNSETNKVKEEVIGTFQQFPLKLAWSITVHKSQGLTFESAIVDVADAFAPGQVYVALSRIKTPDGLILKSRIPASAIIKPQMTEDVFITIRDTANLLQLLEEEKKGYFKYLLNQVFDWHKIKDKLEKTVLNNSNFAKAKDESNKLEHHALVFLNEVENLFSRLGNMDWALLKTRCSKANDYFSEKINLNCIGPLKEFVKTNKADYKFRAEVNLINNIVQLFQEKVRSINMASQLIPNGDSTISYSGNAASIFSSKPIRARKNKNVEESIIANNQLTEEQTLLLFLAGNTISEIASIRGLGISAIEAHLSRYLETGEIKIADIIPEQLLNEILTLLRNFDCLSTIAQLRSVIGDRLSMGQLQALSIYLKQ